MRVRWLSASLSLLAGLALASGGVALLATTEVALLATTERAPIAAWVATGWVAEALRPIDPARPDPSADGTPVYASGEARAPEPPRDPLTGWVGPPGSLALDRIVEMYQWRDVEIVRDQPRAGGGTLRVRSLVHELGWFPGRQRSELFEQPAGHENPPLALSAANVAAAAPRLGSLRLASGMLGALSRVATPAPGPGSVLAAGWQLAGDGLYRGAADPEAPRLGDVRVRYAAVPADRLLEGLRVAASESAWPGRIGGGILVLVGLLMATSPARALGPAAPPAALFLGTAVPLALAPLLAFGTAVSPWVGPRPDLAALLATSGIAAAGGVLWWFRRG